MIEYRLLLSHDVILFLDSLKAAERRRLMKRFLEIAAFPGHHADYEERDETGRRLDVHNFGKYSISFWDDFADRHLKILDVTYSDR